MRLGVMQPYFLPYPGHFALIANTDRWVVFDTAQYTPKRWMNRNRVLGETGGPTWLTVPVQGSSRSLTASQVQIDDMAKTRRTIVGRLRHYQRYAPYGRPVAELVDALLSDPGDGSLVDLNVRGLTEVCSYLGIPFHCQRLSEMDLSLPAVDHPGGWAPAISAALGADEYMNPAGGRDLFDPVEFRRAGVQLLFCLAPEFHYATTPRTFEPGLSIIDAMMWCSPQEIVDYLRSVHIEHVESSGSGAPMKVPADA